jgi:hypothetical protein
LHRRGGEPTDSVEVRIGRRVDCIEIMEHGKPVLRRYHAKDIDRQIRLCHYPAIHKSPRCIGLQPSALGPVAGP